MNVRQTPVFRFFETWDNMRVIGGFDDTPRELTKSTPTVCAWCVRATRIRPEPEAFSREWC